MVVIVLTSLVRIQQHLGTMQSELETAKQAAALMKAQATELAKRIAGLNSELDEATLNAMSFRPNWIRPRRRSNQPNPGLRTSSLIY